MMYNFFLFYELCIISFKSVIICLFDIFVFRCIVLGVCVGLDREES